VTRVMTLLQAMSLTTVPTVSVVIRKAFGLAFVILDANRRADVSPSCPRSSGTRSATPAFSPACPTS